MNKLNEVRQFKKIAGLLKESHPANDMWYEDFEDGLKNLVHNKYISKSEFKYYMDALDHVDPMDDYGHMASGHDAAKEFVDDLRTKTQMDHDNDQYRSETGLEESGTGDELDEMQIDPNRKFGANSLDLGSTGEHIEFRIIEDTPEYFKIEYKITPNSQNRPRGASRSYVRTAKEGEAVISKRDPNNSQKDYITVNGITFGSLGKGFVDALYGTHGYGTKNTLENEVKKFQKIAGIKEVSALKIGKDDIGADFMVVNKDGKKVEAAYGGIRKDGEHVFNAGSETIAISPKDLDAKVSRAGSNLKEDDYSENPSSDMDYDSESGDTATMGNIDEDDMDNRVDQDSKTQYGQGGILNL